MEPTAATTSQAPAQAVNTPAPAPAPAPPTTGNGVANDSMPQGTPHPGVMTPANQVVDHAAAHAANLAAQQAAGQTAQLPPGVTPEAANVAGRAATANAREMAAQMGWTDASRFADDNQFLQAVLQQANAGAAAQQQLAAIQHQQALAYQQQQFAAQQAAAAASPPAPKQNPIWNPPEYNPAWASMVTRDPQTGAVTAIPGVPAEIASKVMAYDAYRKQFADRFMSNPEATLLPLIEQTAQEQARAMIQRELAQQQSKQFIDTFVAQNSSWLHQQGPNGQVVTNPTTGKPVLSAAGARFQAHVVAADSMGIKDVRQQEQYARGMLQRDILQAQAAQFAGQQAAATNVIEANRRPPQGGTLPRPGTAPVPMPGMSLQQQLALAMQANGISDAMIDAGNA